MEILLAVLNTESNSWQKSDEIRQVLSVLFHSRVF